MIRKHHTSVRGGVVKGPVASHLHSTDFFFHRNCTPGFDLYGYSVEVTQFTIKKSQIV